MNIRVAASDTKITVSWDPIKDGNNLVGYSGSARGDRGVGSGALLCYGRDWPIYKTSCVFDNLAPGTIYNITVEAFQIDPDHLTSAGFPVAVRRLAQGTREWVSLCCQVPQAPLTPTSEDRGGGTARVTWTAPAFNGGANTLTYDVTSTPPSAGCSTTELECTIPNLNFSTPYTFQVTAKNSAGSSGAVSTTTPLTLIAPKPGEPTGAKASMSSRVAQVSWKAPVDAKKLAVSSYKVTASPSGKSCVSKKTSCAIKGLSVGTKYTFTVKAFRGTVASGLSRPSLPVSYSPPPAPAPAPVIPPDPKPVPILS